MTEDQPINTSTTPDPADAAHRAAVVASNDVGLCIERLARIEDQLSALDSRLSHGLDDVAAQVAKIRAAEKMPPPTPPHAPVRDLPPRAGETPPLPVSPNLPPNLVIDRSVASRITLAVLERYASDHGYKISRGVWGEHGLKDGRYSMAFDGPNSVPWNITVLWLIEFMAWREERDERLILAELLELADELELNGFGVDATPKPVPSPDYTKKDDNRRIVIDGLSLQVSYRPGDDDFEWGTLVFDSGGNPLGILTRGEKGGSSNA